MNLDKLYDKAYDWVLLAGPRILVALLIFIAAQWLIRWLKKVTRNAMKKREMDASLQPFLMSLLFTILQILLVLGVMQILGIQMTIFAALIGGVGVAAGLALSGSLQNFTSGILILLLKPFRVGDNIIAQGQEGTVTSIQVFYTILLTYDNKDVIIPNSKLSNDLIINISQEGKRRMDLDLKLPYTADYTTVEKILKQTLSASADVLKDPVPRTGITTLDADGFHVAVNAWVNPHGYMDSKMAFQVAMIDDLKKAGVKLPGM